MSKLGRPLLPHLSLPRVISRAQGLKLVVETLMSSLKPIGNIVVICCAFFIIFGILGVQVCEGLRASCQQKPEEWSSPLDAKAQAAAAFIPERNKQGHSPQDLIPQAPLSPGHFAENWELGTGPRRG